MWNGFNREDASGLTDYYYDPSEARVECFGLEIAIRNRDLPMMRHLWNEYRQIWEAKHFAFLIEKTLQEQWEQGLEFIFRSKTSHMIFKALNPEDKENFLNSKIIDKITDTTFWEHSARGPIKLSPKQIQNVMLELHERPYCQLAVLKYPILFQKYGLFDTGLEIVSHSDVFDYVVARKENLMQLVNDMH